MWTWMSIGEQRSLIHKIIAKNMTFEQRHLYTSNMLATNSKLEMVQCHYRVGTWIPLSAELSTSIEISDNGIRI